MEDGLKGRELFSPGKGECVVSFAQLPKEKYIEILVSQNHRHFFLQTGMIVGKTHFS